MPSCAKVPKKSAILLVILAKLGWHFFGDKMARMAGPHATKGGYTWLQSINLVGFKMPFFGHYFGGNSHFSW